MKLRIKARDRAATWHGQQYYTLSLYLEVLSSETRDRVWTAIEKALPDPEGSKKSAAMGMRADEGRP